MSRAGEVLAISVSKKKGIPKENVPSASFITDGGIDGDAHAGSGHRQVSLLAMESIDKIRARGLNVNPGAFAENITTRGVELSNVSIGDQITAGDIVLNITQIGKECHERCAIFDQLGDCVMPREGIFAEVKKGGTLRVGDQVVIRHNSKTETSI